MVISFINEISQQALAELIIWYVKNGHCTITHELICRHPVQLIININPTSTNSPIYSSLRQQIYEKIQILEWFTKSGTQLDPITKGSVKELYSLFDNKHGPSEETSILFKLTNFITTYLSSLQHYVTTGNTPEVTYWLEAWNLAFKMYVSTHKLLSADENVNQVMCALKNCNINLPNGKSLATVAYECKQIELLEIFKHSYYMTHTVSKYDSFMRFIDSVKNHQSVSAEQCEEKFNLHMHDFLQQSTLDEFLTSPILTSLDPEYINGALLNDLNLRPLQFSVIQQMTDVVKMFIRMGAKLTKGELSYSNRSLAKITAYKNSVNHLKSEMHLAVDTGNKEIMLAIKPLCSQSDPSYLEGLVAPYILVDPDMGLVQFLLNELACNINLETLIYHATQPNVFPDFVIFICDNFLAEPVAACRFINSLFISICQSGFIEDSKYNIPKMLSTEKIICAILKCGLPDHIQEDYEIFSRDLQEKITIACDAKLLSQSIIYKRLELMVYGEVNHTNINMLVFDSILYKAIYENYRLLSTVQGTLQRNQFIKHMAQGSIADRDYTPANIAMRMQSFVAIQSQLPMWQSVRSGSNIRQIEPTEELETKKLRF